MNCESAFQKILHSFEKYYTVKLCDATPFCAFAEFHAHGEQYFLVKPAKVADIDTNEYVFFAQAANLDERDLVSLDKAAWERGLSFVKPYFGHRNSDISLVIFCDAADKNAKNLVKKIHHYKSYKFGFFGWSAYNLALYDFSSQDFFSNRRGKNLKDNLQKILFDKGEKK